MHLQEFSTEDIKENDNKTKFYTGLPSWTGFHYSSRPHTEEKEV